MLLIKSFGGSAKKFKKLQIVEIMILRDRSSHCVSCFGFFLADRHVSENLKV